MESESTIPTETQTEARPERIGRTSVLGVVKSVTAPLCPGTFGEARLACDDGRNVKAEGLSEVFAQQIAQQFGKRMVLVGPARWSSNGRMVEFTPEWGTTDRDDAGKAVADSACPDSVA